jgi:hypothetical protein
MGPGVRHASAIIVQRLAIPSITTAIMAARQAAGQVAKSAESTLYHVHPTVSVVLETTVHIEICFEMLILFGCRPVRVGFLEKV